MEALCKSVVALILAALIPQPFLLVAYASEEEWSTVNIVGEHRYSDPPKSDQVFKVYYRVVNGTADSFATKPLIAKVNAEGDGLLEIMFPRNYPYTNHQSGIDNFLINSIVDRMVTDCFFVFSIPFAESDEFEVNWTYLLWQEPWHGDAVPEECIPQTIAQVTPEMLEECEEIGITSEDCSEKEILIKRSEGRLPISEEEQKRIEEQQNQINNSMYMIGIGAAIAGAIAFVTLWRRK